MGTPHMFNLQRFLQNAPRPKRLRIKKGDEEWQFVEVTGGTNIWKRLATTVTNSEASVVECLDGSGNLLRSHKLTEEEKDLEDDFDTPANAADKTMSKALQAQAVMLDAYGRRLNEAFQRGAEAASTSQEKLVALVENLTGHLTVAITNLHNLSTNYANALASSTEGENPNAALLQGVLGLALGGGQARPVSPPDPNGKKK